MTVAELIEVLRGLEHQDREVLVRSSGNHLGEPKVAVSPRSFPSQNKDWDREKYVLLAAEPDEDD